MRKKYIFIVASVFIFVVAGLLMINKDSYGAWSPPEYGNCSYSYNVVFTTNKMNEFISQDKNMIRLPQNMFLLSEPRSFYSGFTYATNAYLLYQFVLEPGYNSVYRIDNDSHSSEIGYLIKNMDLGFSKDEEHYYKQILLLWISDIVSDFDDNYNYYYDNYNNKYVKVPAEEKYSDKFDRNEWAFENALSAGDKKMIKESDVADILENAVKDFFAFVKWYRSDSDDVSLNSVSTNEIYYVANDEYLETNLIYPNADGKPYKYLFEKYKVKVNSPAIIVDSNGDVKDEFDSDEGFKVRIPLESIKNKNFEFNIDISGEFKMYDMALYYGELKGRVEYTTVSPYWYLNNNYIVEDCYSTDENYANTSFNLEGQVGDLNIKVIDTSNGKNLADAEVAIEDYQGNVVYRKITDKNEITVTLPVGDYVVKQTVTPPNYEAITIQKRVTVENDTDKEVVLENALVVSVPDTLSSAFIYLVIGGLIVTAGGILIFKNLIKKKVN